jgi:formylglycine-generating enzyme required for sulfatase activity
MKRLFGSLFLIASTIVLLSSGCTDDDPPTAVDESGPSVAVLYPPRVIDDPWVVSDSVWVYVGARDNDRVERVQVFWSRPNETQRRVINETSTPVSLAEVPEPIRDEIVLPTGWSLYKVFWNTAPIGNGTRPQLFATAVDPSGNSGVSENTTVLILNLGAPLLPPRADFRIVPPEGRADQDFVFDAIGEDPDNPLTVEDIDPLDRVEVRWDFNGDGVWDIDWDQSARATQQQTYRVANPGTYMPRLQARNTYVEEWSEIMQRIVVAVPPDGEPRPPASMAGQFVVLRTGTYGRGAADPRDADSDEFPAHTVRLSFDVNILNREVTNAEYLAYFEAVMDSTPDILQFATNRLYGVLDKEAPFDSLRLYSDFSNGRIFFDVDAGGFLIESGYEDHPVTGVTWYGARAFSSWYGIRLPTEAEWESAARGSNPSWRYPFGTEITDGDSTGQRRVNYVVSGDPFEGDRGTTPVRYYDGTQHGDFQTVDSPSPLGLYDVSGNVAEWCSDWYGPYPTTPVQNDPFGPAQGTFKVVRGGSYLNSVEGVRISDRDGDRLPEDSFASIGFRVAYVNFQLLNNGQP